MAQPEEPIEADPNLAEPNPEPEPDLEADPNAAAPDPAELSSDPSEARELQDLAETSQDEYVRPADAEPDEVSIDDALETDRVVEEQPESRNIDGHRFDETRERGLDDDTAAEQGNRDEDRMVGEGDDTDEVSQIAGSDADAAGTDRDLADGGFLTDGESSPGATGV